MPFWLRLIISSVILPSKALWIVGAVKRIGILSRARELLPSTRAAYEGLPGRMGSAIRSVVCARTN
jgi:hypothetical protein